jgi:hypothetical protein
MDMSVKLSAPGNMLAMWICVALVADYTLGAQYLMRTSPGGDGVRPAGIWAGEVKGHSHGRAEDLFTHGFSSLEGVNSSMVGLEVTVLSRDPVGRGLLVVTKNTQGQMSLALGSGLCGDSKPRVLLHNVKPVDAQNPYMSDTECRHKCGLGPLALYDGRVYFVLTAIYGKIYSQLVRHMEIRLLDTTGNCAEVIAGLGQRVDGSQKDFPVLQCSHLVATLFTEPYTKPNPVVSRWSSQHLTITTRTYDSETPGEMPETLPETPHFYLQLIDMTSGKPEMRLVHVAAGQSGMTTLTSSALADVFTGSYDVSGLGSVDYRDGTLCWSAGDTLRCSLHEPGGDVQPVVVLPSGEARAQGICTGRSSFVRS